MKNLFKYASLLVAAAMLFACDGVESEEVKDNDNDLKLTADKTIIQTFDGDCAVLTVTLGGEPVVEDLVFYKGKGKDKTLIEIPDLKFSTTEPGEHVLTATCGTYISEELTIRAINVKMPETPKDDYTDRTDFKARVLVSQFTTVGCPPCTPMKSKLHGALADEAGNPTALADRVVMTACHSGLVNEMKDPSYISTDYDEFSGMSGFPYIFCDMYYGFNNYTAESSNDVISILSDLYDAKKDVAAGIAVNSSLVDGQLVAKVTVKAAESGNYRVGMFLLEDGIYAKQYEATDEYMNTHDGVIRYIDSEYYSNGKKYYGHSVGKIEVGKTADYVFIWDVEQIWADGVKNSKAYGQWHSLETAMPNLHLAVFTSTVGTDPKGKEFYYVNNVIDCPVNGKTKFDYK